MSICSKILNGLINECSSNQGGISSVWIASLDFPLQIEVGDGVITYIGDGSSIPFNPFVKYNFKKGNASMQTKISIDASTNNKYYDTTLTVTFPKVETVKLLEVDNLLESNNLAAIVGDNNGYYWFLGKDYPMTVTSVDDSWGSNRKDANNIKVTFNCPSKIRPMQTLYLPWEHRPKPPQPIIEDYEVSIFGTKNNDITVTSDWFKSDKLFTEDDYYEVGSIVTVSYKGSENFLGWYDGKTNEFQSQYREYTFRMPKKDVVLVGMIAPILPPTPTKFYDVTVYGTYENVSDKTTWFEDENTLIGTDGYSRGSTAIIEYVGDKEFEGWYIDGEFISNDKHYEIEVYTDIDIVAKLKEPPYVKYKTSDGEWHTDYYADGVIPNQQYNWQHVSGLEEVIIGEGIIDMGESTFGSSGIKKITIPSTVTSIGDSAFFHSSLPSIEIPDSVTTIGSHAFEDCTSLTSVTIPNSVTSIGSGAFNNVSRGGTIYCDEEWYKAEGDNTWSSRLPQGWNIVYVPSPTPMKNIVKSVLDDGSVYYGYFDDGVIPDEYYAYFNELIKIEIGEGIVSIGSQTYEDCSSLSNITMSNSVTSIGSNAFRNVSNSGKLYCDSTWYNGLTDTMKTNLGVVYTNWIPYIKVDSSDAEIGGLG